MSFKMSLKLCSTYTLYCFLDKILAELFRQFRTTKLRNGPAPDSVRGSPNAAIVGCGGPQGVRPWDGFSARDALLTGRISCSLPVLLYRIYRFTMRLILLAAAATVTVTPVIPNNNAYGLCQTGTLPFEVIGLKRFKMRPGFPFRLQHHCSTVLDRCWLYLWRTTAS